ncbi:MAG: diacylglycerol kinase [Sphingomicrobium sp.]
MRSNERRPLHRRAADSLRGLGEGFRRERALRTHLLLSALAIAGLAWAQPGLAWALVVALLLVLGLAAELLNGALEASLDRLHPGHDPEIGAAKDMASAALLVINGAAAVAFVGAMLSSW